MFSFNRSANTAEPTPSACALVHWSLVVLAVAVSMALQDMAVKQSAVSSNPPPWTVSRPSHFLKLEIFLKHSPSHFLKKGSA